MPVDKRAGATVFRRDHQQRRRIPLPGTKVGRGTLLQQMVNW